MKIILSLFLCCFLAAFATNAQLGCSNSIFVNGSLEDGTPTNSHQDIGNAVGFSRIWARGSWADYYPANYAPAGFQKPTPATGNYVSCWISNHNNGNTIYREGFKAELAFTLPKNSGTYNLTFDAACLHGWGTAEIAVYALHNPSGGDAPNPPTGSFTPSNIALFGRANTSLIGTIPLAVSNCNSVKKNHALTINTNLANFPAKGMTHIFVTHSDNQSFRGSHFMAFDNFCIPTKTTCPASWMVNGNLENGTPTNRDQDINLATGFDRIWSNARLSTADYYPANYAPAGFPAPTPATGDYASCWIANHKSGGTTFREGFQTKLAYTISPNTGSYDLSFDMARLYGWGKSEVAVYGINNASGGYGANPTGSFTPSNMALFGASNTVLLGTISINTSNYNNTKTTQTLTFNSANANFPAGGMSHFFVTHSDNKSLNGAHFMAFDDFCLRSATPPCPEFREHRVYCDRNNNYQFRLYATSPALGEMTLSSNCGTFTPSLIHLTGLRSYTTTFIPNGNCGNSINVTYNVKDANGVTCDRGTRQVKLPICAPRCVCDKSFYKSVEEGFEFREGCPNNSVRPLRLLDKCDKVTWTYSGMLLGQSSGNQPFSFRHINRSGELCMTVVRTDRSGKSCKHHTCKYIKPRMRCKPIIILSPYLSARINVNPNPASSTITVTWNDQEMPSDLTVRVFNSNGVVVKTVQNVNGFDGNTSLPIYDLPAGLYFLQIQGEGYTPAPVKFIKK